VSVQNITDTPNSEFQLKDANDQACSVKRCAAYCFKMLATFAEFIWYVITYPISCYVSYQYDLEEKKEATVQNIGAFDDISIPFLGGGESLASYMYDIEEQTEALDSRKQFEQDYEISIPFVSDDDLEETEKVSNFSEIQKEQPKALVTKISSSSNQAFPLDSIAQVPKNVGAAIDASINGIKSGIDGVVLASEMTAKGLNGIGKAAFATVSFFEGLNNLVQKLN